MPHRYKLLKHQLPVARLTIDVLLALRLLYDKPDDISNLDKDINDLARYPERLHDSYRSEWETYVRRALVIALKDSPLSSPAEFVEGVMQEVEEIQQSSERYFQLKAMVEQAQRIVDADNTHLFPTPWRQQLMALLLPVTTITKPDNTE